MKFLAHEVPPVAVPVDFHYRFYTSLQFSRLLAGVLLFGNADRTFRAWQIILSGLERYPEIMNQRVSKTNVDVQTSKLRSTMNLRRGSMRQVHFTEGRKAALNRMSRVSSGSRVFFHKRGDRGKVPKYQNTYRLESFRSLDVEVIDKLVMDTMESKLSGVTAYHPNQMAKLCLEIGSDLQKAICKKDYDRYKLVTQVTIVQRNDQAIHAGFQSLWDVERDNYSYYVFENNHIYAWCCVFGIYYE